MEMLTLEAFVEQLEANRPVKPKGIYAIRRFGDASQYLTHSMMAFETITKTNRKTAQDARKAAIDKVAAATIEFTGNDEDIWQSVDEKRLFTSIDAEFKAIIALVKKG
jgi:hypothetical protein